MAHGTLVRATTDKGGPGVESQVQMNVRLEITSRMPFFFKTINPEERQISSEGTCQGDVLIYWNTCNIGHLPRYGKDGVYVGVRMLPS